MEFFKQKGNNKRRNPEHEKGIKNNRKSRNMDKADYFISFLTHI